MTDQHNIPEAISLDNLFVGYPVSMKAGKTVYDSITACAGRSEMVGVIGRNGIGKSTLLRTIAGLQPPLKGSVFLNGTDSRSVSLKAMARLISFVSTETVYAWQIKVNELVAMGRFPYTGWLGKLNETDREIIGEAVAKTGIEALLSKNLHELSDGERQKVMIARALAQDTPFVILDEPTAFLDLPARYEIFRLLSELSRHHQKTIVFSTHDLSMAMDVADKLWLMTDTGIYQGAPEDLLISKVFRKLFLNSPAEFDEKTATFRFKRNLEKAISVAGEKKFRMLTRRALERVGFQITDDHSGWVVKIADNNGTPVWHVNMNGQLLAFDTIYALTLYVKSLT
ncbi:MAG: ABC transporter ATP-binding protein [Bacteroidales bacterium]|nr:ABC transporter ATP-binding protein [Bacteroidales bacterium]